MEPLCSDLLCQGAEPTGSDLSCQGAELTGHFLNGNVSDAIHGDTKECHSLCWRNYSHINETRINIVFK